MEAKKTKIYLLEFLYFINYFAVTHPTTEALFAPDVKRTTEPTDYTEKIDLVKCMTHGL